MQKIKLFITDMDGTLTDGTMYVGIDGEKLKQFSHRDGRGIYLLNKSGIKTCFITTEEGGINAARAAKLQKLGTLDYFQNGVSGLSKLQYAQKIAGELGIDLRTEAAFIGDDTNDDDLFDTCYFIGCPCDAVEAVKNRKTINIMDNGGGHGAVREFIDLIFKVGMI